MMFLQKCSAKVLLFSEMARLLVQFSSKESVKSSVEREKSLFRRTFLAKRFRDSSFLRYFVLSIGDRKLHLTENNIKNNH